MVFPYPLQSGALSPDRVADQVWLEWGVDALGWDLWSWASFNMNWPSILGVSLLPASVSPLVSHQPSPFSTCMLLRE